MTDFGEFKSDNSPWAVKVPAVDRKLNISRKMALGSAGISPDKWRAQAGWFVFIENEERAWAYDGDKYLVLVEITAGGGIVYGPTNFPCPVPEEVQTRLTEAMRQMLQNKESKAAQVSTGESAELRAARVDLALLRQRYQEKHPMVARQLAKIGPLESTASKESNTAAVSPSPLVIDIQADGTCQINHFTFNLASLTTHLEKLAKENGEFPVTIRRIPPSDIKTS